MGENTDYYEEQIIKLLKDIKDCKTKEMLFFLIKRLYDKEKE